MRALAVALLLLVGAASARAEEPVLEWGAVEVRSPVPLADVHLDPDLGLAGKPVAEHQLESVIEHMLGAFAAAGYPFAVIRPEKFDLDAQGKLHGVLTVEPGIRPRITGLVLDGAAVTTDKVATRMAGLHPGEAYTGAEAVRARDHLLRTGLFLDVGEVSVLPGPGRDEVVLQTKVVEPPYTRFRGVLGVSGPESEVTGLVDLNLRNLAGTGREASGSWENRGGGLARYRLRYREPWLPLVPVGLEGALRHDVNETEYSYTNWEGSGDLSLGPWTVRLGGGGAHATEVVTGGVNSDEGFILGGLTLDLRNSVLVPTAGWKLDTQNRRGKKSFSAVDTLSAVPDRVNRTRWEANLEAYHRFGRPWVGALFGSFRYLDTPEPVVPTYDLFAIGGAYSLRGYREEQFHTTMAATVQGEWRLLQGERGSAVFAFIDTGWIAGDPAPGQRDNLNEFLLGYGLGVRQAAKAGVFLVEYGIARGENPLDGRIHLGVDAAF